MGAVWTSGDEARATVYHIHHGSGSGRGIAVCQSNLYRRQSPAKGVPGGVVAMVEEDAVPIDTTFVLTPSTVYKTVSNSYNTATVEIHT